MPKVSVIMPAYKVEKYLRQCLDSVINQTLEDIEIIPVDDGSPDNCGKIIDEYAAKDIRIKPIHQENGGYGKAVNAGINAATGEYIGIVETDDFIEPQMYERLYNRAKELDADVCKCDFNYYFGNNDYKRYNKFCNVAEEGELFTLWDKPQIMNYHVSIWSAIYKREYLNKNNIRVIETKTASYQDMPFAANVYAKGAKITLIHDSLLNYRTEEGMNSSTIRTDSRLRIMPVMCLEAMKIFKENGCWEVVKPVAYRQFYNCSVNMFFQTDNEYKRAHFDELVKLFKDFDETCNSDFKKKDLKIINYIINGDYDNLYKYAQWRAKKEHFRKFRKNFISIRWNDDEKFINLLGLKITVPKKEKKNA